ncbi:MAG: hypothetical protein J0L67_17360 [Cytophagales bacterium]|nr:hypothetical protein [Cytophagales bacterium]
MKHKKPIFSFVFVLINVATFSQSSNLILSFNNNFGSEPLVFGKEYTNAHGENLRFTLLNYFISNIELIRTDGSVYAIPQDSCYFLVKHNLPESRNIQLSVPAGKYKSLSFTIGIDSARNTQSADKRQGVLDVGGQARGMYWAWNSGYIFYKMEGKSSSLPDSINGFYYHIGGFGGFDSPTLNNIRIKKLELAKTKVSAKKTPVLTITVDVAKFFNSQTPIKVTENRSIMWGPVSTQIADNYVDIFSLTHIHYKPGSK